MTLFERKKGKRLTASNEPGEVPVIRKKQPSDFVFLEEPAGKENFIERYNQSRRLLMASEKGDIETARDALSKGAYVDFRADLEMTVLFDLKHILGDHWNPLEDEARAELNRYAGETSLMKAAYAGNKELVELLISHGADVNACTVHDSCAFRNALEYACNSGHHDIVELLRKHGAR